MEIYGTDVYRLDGTGSVHYISFAFRFENFPCSELWSMREGLSMLLSTLEGLISDLVEQRQRTNLLRAEGSRIPRGQRYRIAVLYYRAIPSSDQFDCIKMYEDLNVYWPRSDAARRPCHRSAPGLEQDMDDVIPTRAEQRHLANEFTFSQCTGTMAPGDESLETTSMDEELDEICTNPHLHSSFDSARYVLGK
jgi:hypothetical protein